MILRSVRGNEKSIAVLSIKEPRLWNDIDSLILAMLLSKEFILDYFGIGLSLNLIICCSILIRILCSTWRIPSFVFLSIGFLSILLALNYCIGGSLVVFIGNMLRVFQVIIYALYLVYLKRERSEFLRNMYGKGAYLFNGVLLINLLVMYIQYRCPGAFVAVSNGPALAGEDLISGLFGYGSTHVVAIYTTFVVVYDIDLLTRMKTKGPLLIFTLVMSVLSLYIATLNDNKALFFFLPLGVILYAMIWASFDSRRIRGLFIAFFVVSLVMMILFWSSTFFRSFVEQNIFHSIHIAMRALEEGAYVNGSDERFKMIVFALGHEMSWALGDGFGLAGIYQEGYVGFNHFGMSDYGSLIVLGGIWFYALLVVFYTKSLTFDVLNHRKNKGVIVFVIVILIVASSMFTQIFTQVRIAIPFLMLGYALYSAWTHLSSAFIAKHDPSAASLPVKLEEHMKKAREDEEVLRVGRSEINVILVKNILSKDQTLKSKTFSYIA